MLRRFEKTPLSSISSKSSLSLSRLEAGGAILRILRIMLLGVKSEIHARFLLPGRSLNHRASLPVVATRFAVVTAGAGEGARSLRTLKEIRCPAILC